MAKKTVAKVKRGRRTEALSLRLDPKDKFILDYIVRVTGMPITTVVERAIRTYTNVSLGDAPDWEQFWDVSEGVRMLQMLSHPDVISTYEEDALVKFTHFYQEFFYWNEPYTSDTSKWRMKKDNVSVLWPEMHQLMDVYGNPRTGDRKQIEATKDAMEEILNAHELSVEDLPF